MSAALITATSHTGVTVSDLDRAIKLFRDVLGCDVTQPAKYRGSFIEGVTGIPGAVVKIAYVKLPGHQLELLQYLEPGDRRRSDLRPCDTGSLHLAFYVDDLDLVLKGVGECGFEPVNAPQTVPAGPRKGARTVYTRDADGVVLEFQESLKG
jgi:catechol 2,3-dioxygenase-like lactoylglutathione lyase family enzyme